MANNKKSLYKKAINGDVMAQIKYLSENDPEHWKCSKELMEELKYYRRLERLCDNKDSIPRRIKNLEKL